MANLSYTELQTAVEDATGESIVRAKMNRAIRVVNRDIDLISMKRKVALPIGLFDEVYDYPAPSDLKGQKIIDIKPVVQDPSSTLVRGQWDDWRLTTTEEFDRLKENVRQSTNNVWGNILTIDSHDITKKIRIAKNIQDNEIILDTLDSVSGWSGFGDGEDVVIDTNNYIKGSGSIKFDIDSSGGTTAGIVNSTLPSQDISAYVRNGSIFSRAFITDETDLTNYIIRIGSSSSAYNSITITSDVAGNSFTKGWNLLKFDLSSLAITGAVDNTAITYIALFMTKATGKISEDDYRFDQIILKLGNYVNIYYYSRLPWKNSSGTYIVESTADTDTINLEEVEVDLLIDKYIEINHRDNQDIASAREAKVEYLEGKQTYELDNPSEALVVTPQLIFNSIYDLNMGT